MRTIFLALFVLSIGVSAHAERNQAALRTSITYTPVYQFETDIDQGGSFAVDRHFLHLDFFKPFSRETQVGLGLHIDYEHWDFKNTASVSTASPWQEVHRPSLNITLLHSLSRDWRLLFSPSIGLAATDLSNTSDSLVYGAVFSLMRQLGPDLSLGVGAGVFERIEKTKVFPFLAIKWKINENFKLQNPFSAGPVGPAGLELVYNSKKRWDLGIGGAYRSYRFRLGDRNSVPDGVGENEFIAAFLRGAYHFDPQVSLSLSAGGLFAGDLQIEDASGNKVDSSGYDTAPFVGLTFRGRF